LSKFITGYSEAFEGFNQIENAQYDKYKIDGHKAGSVVFSFELPDLDLAGWIVVTIIGNKLFAFQYGADQNQFDINLPTAQRILQSIKILDK
jgi:hypothetical protein